MKGYGWGGGRNKGETNDPEKIEEKVGREAYVKV